MQEGLTRRRLPWGPAGDVLAIAVISLLLRAPLFGQSSWDESIFGLVAREILNGHWPFTTVFDHKPIGLYLHFAAAYALFGDNPIAARILGWVVVTATALAVRSILVGPIGLGREPSFFIAVALLIASLGLGGESVMSEHFVNLYVTLSALSLLRRSRFDLALAGAWAVIAISTNYLAIPVAAGLVAGYVAMGQFTGRERLREVALFAGGAAVAAGIVHSPLFLFSNLGDYFGPQFAFLAGYSDDASIPQRMVRFAGTATVLIPLLAAGLALLFLTRGHDRTSAGRQGELRPLAGMAFGAVIATMASGYGSPHYVLLTLPPLFLWAGALARRAHGRSQKVLFGVAIASTSLVIGLPGLVYTAIGAADLVAKVTRDDLRFDRPRQIARIARARLGPGGTVFTACTSPTVYQLLHVRPPTKYPFSSHLLSPRFASALGIDVDRELEAIFAKRPEVVVLGGLDHCWRVPPSALDKVRHKIRDYGYRPYERFGGFTFFDQPR